MEKNFRRKYLFLIYKLMRDCRTSKQKVVHNAEVEMYEIFNLVVADKKNVPWECDHISEEHSLRKKFNTNIGEKMA